MPTLNSCGRLLESLGDRRIEFCVPLDLAVDERGKVHGVATNVLAVLRPGHDLAGLAPALRVDRVLLRLGAVALHDGKGAGADLGGAAYHVNESRFHPRQFLL